MRLCDWHELQTNKACDYSDCLRVQRNQNFLAMGMCGCHCELCERYKQVKTHDLKKPNVEMSGLRGFSRRSARLKGYAAMA